MNFYGPSCLVAGICALVAGLVAVPAPAAHAQPPETVLIQGQLLDDLGQPLTGARGYRVRFFDAEASGAQLGGDIVGQTILSPSGLFAIPLEPPAAVLEASAAWYELAIDSSADTSGLTEADAFPGRIRVHSVPFARVAGQALNVEVEAIGGGAVSAVEFESLAGITGSVQSQLDAKANTTAVDDALDLKADQDAVDDALADKADLAEVLPRAGESFVVVETTDDPLQNGANLLAAYAEAAALTPHGEGLSENNRAVVIVPPGNYGLGSGQLVMDTPFVDLVGSTTARDNHHIFGTSNGPDTGVLRQTADHVRIENLLVECTRDSGGFANNSSDPAAYFPTGGLANTVVRNCRFLADDSNARSMRVAIEYAGIYEDCVGASRAFGGEGGIASGTFTNCTGGARAFGGEGLASGTFTHCTGGANAFGGFSGDSTGGNFIGCEMTSQSWSGTFRGRMENCRWNAGITLGSEARVYASTFLGAVNLQNNPAGLTQSRAVSIIDGSNNVFGATSAAAFNILSADLE